MHVLDGTKAEPNEDDAMTYDMDLRTLEHDIATDAYDDMDLTNNMNEHSLDRIGNSCILDQATVDGRPHCYLKGLLRTADGSSPSNRMDKDVAVVVDDRNVGMDKG